jgi:hypothetical protein
MKKKSMTLDLQQLFHTNDLSLDLVADVLLARKGESHMALTGVYATPAFNLLFGMGMSFTYMCIRLYPESYRVHQLDRPLFFLSGTNYFVETFSCKSCQSSLKLMILQIGFRDILTWRSSTESFCDHSTKIQNFQKIRHYSVHIVLFFCCLGRSY